MNMASNSSENIQTKKNKLYYNAKSLGENCAYGINFSESLSAEEHHTLKHMQRQEPQGEERVAAYSSPTLTHSISKERCSKSKFREIPDLSTSFKSTPKDTCNDNNLSISSNSNSNTLIIHHSVPEESWSNKWLSGYHIANSKTLREKSELPTESIDSPSFVSQDKSIPISETMNTNIAMPNSLSSSNLNSYLGNPTSGFLDKDSTFYRIDNEASAKYTNPTEIPDIPSSYLDQSEVLKHLINNSTKDLARGTSLLNSSYGRSTSASGAFSDQSASSSNSAINIIQADRGSISGSSSHGSQYINSLFDKDDVGFSLLLHHLDHPPPAYSPWFLDNSPSIKDTVDSKATKASLISKSQPDLTCVGEPKYHAQSSKELIYNRFSTSCIENEENPVFLREIVDFLFRENDKLKVDIGICNRKVTKLKKFELEMSKVEEQYEALVKLCERREQLERLARHKLQTESRRVAEQNQDLKARLEVLRNHCGPVDPSNPSASSEYPKKELSQRDVFIAQLVSQNKELVATKERQLMELTAQRQTLNEQRTHIDILDSALTNAQANIVKLEEEIRKKQSAVEQASQLKRLLLSIKLASDKREQSEKNLRQKLEMEIFELKSNGKLDHISSDTGDLKRELRAKDEKIMTLDADLTKWEQRFLQESAMRQVSMEAASLTKDVKIASLGEKNDDGERRIAQAKSDQLRHLDEIQNMNKNISALEARNQTFETLNAEKEIMINVLHKQIEDNENKYRESDIKLLSGSNGDLISKRPNVTLAKATTSHVHCKIVGGFDSTAPLLYSTPTIPRKDEELGEILL